jgi:hypothetical protein
VVRGRIRRPPEEGDARSALYVEPPPWTDEALDELWSALGLTEPTLLAATVLPWVIGPGPRPNNTSRLTRTLYAPDNPNQKTQSDGKDVKAIKRMVSRAGFWRWQDFDHNYSNAFAHGAEGPTGSGPGVDGLRAALGTGDGSGTLNERTYHALLYGKVPEGGEHAGDWICDPTSEVLLEDYYAAWIKDNPPPKAAPDEPAPKPPSTASKADVENALAGYCYSSVTNEPKIHYQQVRPMRSLGVSPVKGFTADCSEHSTCAYYWARQETGVAVPDPNHNGYNGAGYTGTLVNNPRVSAPYRIGDLAIYGPGTGAHVCTCFGAGDAYASRWCSHGSEAAPYEVDLHYRGDLQCVVRPGLMP